MRPVDVGHGQVQHDQGPGPGSRQRSEELAKMAALGVLPGKTEAHVDGRHGAALAHQLSNQDRTVETAARQHGNGIWHDHRRYGSPRYTQPELQVSRTITWESSGSAGVNRSQIHWASTSLVGFSRPSISLR